jgi:hypothetical protein
MPFLEIDIPLNLTSSVSNGCASSSTNSFLKVSCLSKPDYFHDDTTRDSKHSLLD